MPLDRPSFFQRMQRAMPKQICHRTADGFPRACPIWSRRGWPAGNGERLRSIAGWLTTSRLSRGSHQHRAAGVARSSPGAACRSECDCIDRHAHEKAQSPRNDPSPCRSFRPIRCWDMRWRTWQTSPEAIPRSLAGTSKGHLGCRTKRQGPASGPRFSTWIRCRCLSLPSE